MTRKTKLYYLWSLLVCIAMIIGCFALWKNRNLKVYDDKFKVLSYSISTGPSHVIYNGNQTVGRIRTKLRNTFGFKFISLSPATIIKGPKTRIFLLRYTGDFPFEELNGLRVMLTNDKDISRELINFNMPFQTGQSFFRYSILPVLPRSEDSFRIDLILESADDPVASWRVGKLYRNKEWSISE